jgi:hypothetical protein
MPRVYRSQNVRSLFNSQVIASSHVAKHVDRHCRVMLFDVFSQICPIRSNRRPGNYRSSQMAEDLISFGPLRTTSLRVFFSLSRPWHAAGFVIGSAQRSSSVSARARGIYGSASNGASILTRVGRPVREPQLSDITLLTKSFDS